MSDLDTDVRSVTNAELVAEFMRICETNVETVLQVAIVKWSGPHEPMLAWTTFRRWKRPPTPERLAAAQQKALTMGQCFRVCQRCGERKNVGHMHNRLTCQTCAERHLAVVY